MKKALTLFAALCMSAAAFAQNAESTPKQIGYLGVSAGAQVFNGMNDSRLDFGDRVAPVIELTGGVWVTQAIALDLNLSGAQFRGLYAYPFGNQHFQTSDQHITDGNVYTFDQRGWYLQADVNARFDLNTLFWGYKYNRHHHFVPYFGGGVATGSCGHSGGPAGLINLGLQYKYNITPNWAVFGDFKSTWIGKGLENEVCDEHSLHNVYGLRIGFSYTFMTK